MRAKWSGLLFLIRSDEGVSVTTKCPKDVAINRKRNTWSLRGLPPGSIGDFDARFYYNDSKKGLIGVFCAYRPRHMINMIRCFNAHLRDVLGQPLDKPFVQ